MKHAILSLMTAALVLLSTSSYAQTVFAYPGANAQFDIVAADLATANSYVYRTYTDAQTTGVILPATCTGTISPFTCVAPFPVQTEGAHTITATAANATAESARPPAFSFTWTNTPPPNAPSTIRIAAILDVFPETAELQVEDPFKPHANARHLVVTTWPLRMVGSAVVMKFAFPAFPPNTVVESAVLFMTLDAADSLGTNQYRVSVHKLLSASDATATGINRMDDPVNGPVPWTQSTCCSGGISMAQADITTAYAIINVGVGLNEKQWNITKLVQEWIAHPAENFGLLLNPDLTKLGDRFRSFAGLSAPKVQDWPFLRVTVVS